MWLPEDYFFLGGVAGAALALGATARIPVGIGVVSSVARHPALLAMEISTLARAHPGRLIPGIGHGVPGWTGQMGLTQRSPMSALRETLTGVRALLNGETVDAEGRFATFRQVAIAHPVPDRVPLFTGVLGDKGLELTGRLADGLLVSALAPVEYVRSARRKLDEAARAAGRDERIAITVLTAANVTRDPGQVAATRKALKTVLAFYLAATGPGPLFDAVGANEQLADLLSRGGPEVVAAEMPDSWIDVFGIVGGQDTARARIEDYLDAGADNVAIATVVADGAEETVAAVGELTGEFTH
ncbi:alkanesulfonate monooxygenase SsuD/methylene tetrahydromethanopterin reductase-like flavin-dependent oxidoreductase (luciferase family) [Amycolatopsis jiangsuensis]|uniref:Alkanesulfonate monooxygenase SsuD/methylene tetrahydromethanopterin reductase-like flavin-dependent oxidoreductase (Luciferase family) n=1 Tax=Amycolatopsis jiangsuensis TaxID=1181879 RepID=A0A840J076_9PSEU|nr:LLM class flavin-dependent oxidoreductase [Amycolatopsis jiangsuensis]MBB4686927.1 alkanesulfonate monooxygenase SsuD/methylene tetrahydromethanopterin reductase-like flavin-dependent oxidoreductase (luciferase family) [Amycolatopsis jiangsuensis]